MSGFDKLARPYRWMEFLSFGRALERCRFAFLTDLHDVKSILLLGDGDGRFTAKALLQAPEADAVAIDGSEAMLHALQTRCRQAGTAQRVATLHADLRSGLPQSLAARRFDMVATHFFLDCLTDAEVDRIASDVTQHATCDARWIISEFAVPERGAMRLPSRIVVRMLYLSFRILTGLRPQHLPCYRKALQEHGWRMRKRETRLGGLLVSEMWQPSSHEA